MHAVDSEFWMTTLRTSRNNCRFWLRYSLPFCHLQFHYFNFKTRKTFLPHFLQNWLKKQFGSTLFFVVVIIVAIMKQGAILFLRCGVATSQVLISVSPLGSIAMDVDGRATDFNWAIDRVSSVVAQFDLVLFLVCSCMFRKRRRTFLEFVSSTPPLCVTTILHLGDSKV